MCGSILNCQVPGCLQLGEGVPFSCSGLQVETLSPVSYRREFSFCKLPEISDNEKWSITVKDNRTSLAVSSGTGKVLLVFLEWGRGKWFQTTDSLENEDILNHCFL